MAQKEKGVNILPPPSGEFKQDEQQNTLPRVVSLTDLQKMLEIGEFAIYTPFIFTTTNGAITEIQEKYIP